MKRNLIIAAVLMLACCLSAKAQQQEWPNYARYAQNNKEILEAQKNGAKKPLAVLMGGSITDGWYAQDPEFFKDNNLVGRGISGQCTAHMLARFRRDVIDLHPKYVAILAGTNDIALNNGFSSKENALGNIISMVELAKANKIKVILCSTTPSDHFGWRPEVKDALDQIKWLNQKVEEYAKANHIPFVNYAAALADKNGATNPEYSGDSVHPNIKGYKVMEALLMKVLK